MIRNILGIIAGYLVFGISSALLFGISKVDPTQPATTNFMILSAIIGGLAALTGGYLTGLIVKQKINWPIITLSIIMALIGMISIFAQPGKSYWSELLTIFIFAPLAFIGGYLRSKQK